MSCLIFNRFNKQRDLVVKLENAGFSHEDIHFLQGLDVKSAPTSSLLLGALFSHLKGPLCRRSQEIKFDTSLPQVVRNDGSVVLEKGHSLYIRVHNGYAAIDDNNNTDMRFERGNLRSFITLARLSAQRVTMQANTL